MKLKRFVSVVMTLLLCFSAVPAAVSAESTGTAALANLLTDDTVYQSFSGTITAERANIAIKKYGNVEFEHDETTIPDGYEFGDVVLVRFMGKELTVPYCNSFSDVDSGQPGLFLTDGHLALAINFGDFATTYGVAVKDADTGKWTLNSGDLDHIDFSFSMYEKGGYYDEYLIHHLSYSDNRAEYPDLSDEAFANFRQINTSGIAAGTLYRTSSPIDPRHKRNKIADDALRKAAVTVIMNLADNHETAREYEGYDSTYYSGTKIIALEMDMDPTADATMKKLAEGLRFFADNPGVYAIHCREGKDRAGFACAIIECLMGASLKEVTDDYMISFCNYYGVTPDDNRYEVIKNSNLLNPLKKVFGADDLTEADLAAEAEEYLIEGGMSAKEIAALKSNLAAEQISKLVNPLKIKVSSKTYKRKKLTKSRTFIIGASNGQGKVTYTPDKKAKKVKIKVSAKGKVTVPKKCRKGIYMITVRAAGNDKYKVGRKTVKIMIK